MSIGTFQIDNNIVTLCTTMLELLPFHFLILFSDINNIKQMKPLSLQFRATLHTAFHAWCWSLSECSFIVLKCSNAGYFTQDQYEYSVSGIWILNKVSVQIFQFVVCIPDIKYSLLSFLRITSTIPILLIYALYQYW